MMGPHFTPTTLRFLRALKRNNNRDWFKARKEEYEACVRAPMVGVIERLAKDFRSEALPVRRRPRVPRLAGRKRRVLPDAAAHVPGPHASREVFE
jgi:uncharacterized protein (DUF2461 family)